MAEAFNHDTGSAVATTVEKAGIGAALGFVASVVVGAAVAIGGLFAATAIGGSLGGLVGFQTTAKAATAALWNSGGAITALVGIGGAVAGGGMGTIPAAIGGLLGLAKGNAQVSREKSAYARQAELVAGTHGKKVAEIGTDRYLQGYMDGANEVGQIREQVGMQKGAQAVIEHMQNNIIPAGVMGAEPASLGEAATSVPPVAANSNTLSMSEGAAAGVEAGAVATAMTDGKFTSLACKAASHGAAIKDGREAMGPNER